jgi:hypothetical protein
MNTEERPLTHYPNFDQPPGGGGPLKFCSDAYLNHVSLKGEFNSAKMQLKQNEYKKITDYKL